MTSARKSLGHSSFGYESFDHIGSTAERPKTVLNIRRSSRASSVAPFDMSGMQQGFRPASAIAVLCTVTCYSGLVLSVRPTQRWISLNTRISPGPFATILQWGSLRNRADARHGLLLRFQTASHLLPDRPAEAKLRNALRHALARHCRGRAPLR